MQYRMQMHHLWKERLDKLLTRAETGCLATLNEDGSPYNLPVHFVYWEGKVYIHGLPRGQKMNNILRDKRVCFTAYDFQGLLLDPNGAPCDTNTKYESAVLTGNASLVTDEEEKRAALGKIIEKYTPHLAEVPIADNMLHGTAVVRIDIVELTGKYYA